jgi:hypothetical protein
MGSDYRTMLISLLLLTIIVYVVTLIFYSLDVTLSMVVSLIFVFLRL